MLVVSVFLNESLHWIDTVYKIILATYIGETGRNLNMRLTEHKLATKNEDKTNHIAEHHQQTKHN